jgi:hypothetical protein
MDLEKSPALGIWAIGALLLFIVGFAMSAGPIIWVICAEIFPLSGRDLGVTFSTATNWIVNAIVGGTFLTLLGIVNLRSMAARMLLNDLKECEADLHVIFDPTPATMSLSRWEALMDMRYNLGPSGFRGFKRMIQAIKGEDWDTAADECMDSAYARQVPNRARENATALKLG